MGAARARAGRAPASMRGARDACNDAAITHELSSSRFALCIEASHAGCVRGSLAVRSPLLALVSLWRLPPALFLLGCLLPACNSSGATGCPPGTRDGGPRRCEFVGVDNPAWTWCAAPGSAPAPASPSDVTGHCCSASDIFEAGVDDAGLCTCIPPNNKIQCLFDSDCCSGRCWDAGWENECIWKGAGSPCDSGTECSSGVCAAGVCTCMPSSAGYCFANSDCCSGVCSSPPYGTCQ